jgi:probable H4MPT-linked C1 transfer pathway protein
MCVNRSLFSSAKEGTHYIVDLGERLFGDKVRYLGLSYRLYTAKEAKEQYLNVACRNWVATCYLASPYLGLFENGLVLDCGTNSTDIVPVLNSTPITLDDNDQEYTRFKTGELLWSGLYFTHVLSITNTIVLDGEEFQVRTNTNALISDAYIVLGMISPKDLAAEYSERRDIGKSFQISIRRILDLIVTDSEILGVDDAQKIAQFLAEKQREKTEKAIKKVLSATQKKHKTDLRIAAIAGAGKDIILRKALENLDFEEIIDIEKVASENLDITDSHSNCETSLGCALMGLHAYKKA